MDSFHFCTKRRYIDQGTKFSQTNKMSTMFSFRVKNILFQTIIIFIVVFAFSQLLSIAFASFFHPYSFISSSAIKIITTDLFLICCSLIVLAKYFDKEYIRNLFSTKNIKFKSIITALLLGLGLSIISAIIASFTGLGMDLGFKETNTISVVFYLIFLAPFAEELFCRGLLQSLLYKFFFNDSNQKKYFSFSLSVIISAFLFSLMHLVLLTHNKFPTVLFVMIFTFCLGLISGKYRENTGSIVHSFIVHSAFNLIGALKVVIMLLFFSSFYNPAPIDKNFKYNFDLNNDKAWTTSVNAYIQQNIKFPEAAKHKLVSGFPPTKFFVPVSFAVDTNGKVIDVKIDEKYSGYKIIGYGCEEEAIRLIKSLPIFKPYKENGTPQKTYSVVEVSFRE